MRKGGIEAIVLEYEKSGVIVAEEKNRLVGAIAFWGYYPGLKTAYLDLVAVKASFRGKGIGRTLCKKAIGELHKRGIKKIKVSTNTGNKTAQHLYKSLGFKTYKTKKNAKGPGTHKLYMKQE